MAVSNGNAHVEVGGVIFGVKGRGLVDNFCLGFFGRKGGNVHAKSNGAEVLIQEVGAGIKVLEEKRAIIDIKEIEKGEGEANCVGVLTKEGTSGGFVWVGLMKSGGERLAAIHLGSRDSANACRRKRKGTGAILSPC